MFGIAACLSLRLSCLLLSVVCIFVDFSACLCCCFLLLYIYACCVCVWCVLCFFDVLLYVVVMICACLLCVVCVSFMCGTAAVLCLHLFCFFPLFVCSFCFVVLVCVVRCVCVCVCALCFLLYLCM